MFNLFRKSPDKKGWFIGRVDANFQTKVQIHRHTGMPVLMWNLISYTR